MNRTDTTSLFYSNIDRLIKLVDVAIEKKQTKNAEKYLNYFFEVTLKYYQKSKGTRSLQQEQPQFISTSTSTKLKDETEPYFPKREINNLFGDFFTDKIMYLISVNITSGSFEIFYFIISKLKDCIRILIKDKSTFENGSLLLRQFKFILDQINIKQSNLSNYEKNWFLGESYNWFIELYSTNISSVKEIELLESEIIQILKYFVDNNRVDLFKKFLLRLSSSTFGYHFSHETIINSYRPTNYPSSFEYDQLIREIRRNASALQSTIDFDEYLKKIENSLVLDLEKLGVNGDLQDLKKKMTELLFDEFKEGYLKIILTKIIVYALFKKQYDFFGVYLTYNQPDDSDATWASKYYGLNINDVFTLLSLGENLVLRDHFFWIEHHGFSIYLNTLLGYYLMINDESQILSRIRSINDYQKAVLTEYGIRNIKSRNNITEFRFGSRSFNKEEIETKLSRIIEEATNHKEQLDFKIIKESFISSEILESFKSLFVEQFYKSCTVRTVFKYYNHITQKQSSNQEQSLGINTLLHKKAFLKQSDVLYFNLHGSLADDLAESETFNLLFTIEQKCKKISLSHQQLEQYLQERKKDFDIILSKGRYIIKNDFPNLSFQESWSIDSALNQIPDFMGFLESHYNVFFFRAPSKEGYILLDSKNLGDLCQLEPPTLKNGERLDIFNFSIIDFSQDEESLNEHLKEGMEKDEVLKHIWLRIFENFKLEIPVNFKGTYIEITN
jgi:hypothetical protein